MKDYTNKNFDDFTKVSVNISSPKHFSELLVDDNFNKHIVSEKNAKKINFDITININQHTTKNITICMVCYENKIFQGFFFEKQGIFYDKYNKKGSHYLSIMPKVNLKSLYLLLLYKMFSGNELMDYEKKACAISLIKTWRNLYRKNQQKIIQMDLDFFGIRKSKRFKLNEKHTTTMKEYLNDIIFPLVSRLHDSEAYRKVKKNILSSIHIESLEDLSKKINDFYHNRYNKLKLINLDNNITNIDNNITLEPKNIVNNNSLQTKITFNQQNQQSGVMKEGGANNQKNKEVEQEKPYKQEDEKEIIVNNTDINLHDQETMNTSQGQNETISDNQTKQGKQQKECYLFKNNSLQTKITFNQQNQQCEVIKKDDANNKQNTEVEQEKLYKQEDEKKIIANNTDINLHDQETMNTSQGQKKTILDNKTTQGKQYNGFDLLKYLNICNCCKICKNEEEQQKNKNN